MSKNNQNTQVYTTTRGKKVTLLPLSPYLSDKVKNGFIKHFEDEHGSMPTPPTYDADIGGEMVAHEHDLTSLDDDMHTEEEKAANHAAWDEYQRMIDLFSTGETTAISEAILRNCVEFEYPKEDWKGRQELDYIIIPENEHELKLHFIQTELISSVEDLKEMVTIVLSLSGVAQEDLETVKASFRSKVEGDTPGESEDRGKVAVGG